MILYEHPFNERIRTLLRLEDLFERSTFFLEQDHVREHHAALMTLFEIADVTSRTDLRSELIKELDRQRHLLMMYRGNPAIEPTMLENMIVDIENTLSKLNQMHGKAGQHFSDNEWLNSIRNRAAVPGGTCRFDLPSYYAWQQKSAEERRSYIRKWEAPFLPIRDAARIVLKIVRESSQVATVTAVEGSYQQMLSGRAYQLMQIRVAPELHVIPEASANRHMLWIRFTTQDGDMRPHPIDKEVPFQLSLCNL